MGKLLRVLPCIALMSACGSSQANGSGADLAGKGASKAVPANAAFKVGVNLSTINSWDGNRPFLNLIYGSSWQMHDPSAPGALQEVPFSSLDGNGWVKSVPRGYVVVRGLSVPLAGGDFACHYRGEGTISVTGAAVSNIVTLPRETRFTLKTTYPHPEAAMLTYKVTPRDYIRNIDCRERNAAGSEALAPELISALSGFKIIRFLNWQVATPENTPVTWANRNKPGDGDYLKRDGVPVELIVETANKTGADAWVTIPWNADEDYVSHFATYVRDTLAPGHQVYVEVSNEVWNGGYPVSAQACNEAKSERLPGVNGGSGCSLERYAEKTSEVMQIWSKAFAGHMDGLVRVASFNHTSPYWSDAMLGYQHLNQSVDALATAPYFGYDFNDSLSFDGIMSALPAKVKETIALGLQQKAIARKYGLRYVAYEGGQHIVLPNNVPLLKKIERDPRMYEVYKQFLTAWRDQIGDNLNLYAHVGSISRYGAWGLSDYVGQPLADAPKLRAVRDILVSSSSSPAIIRRKQMSTDQRAIAVREARQTGNFLSKLGSKLN